MNEQVSLAFSIQPDGTTSVSISVIPINGDGSIASDRLLSANISSVSASEQEAALISAIGTALSSFRTLRGI